MTNQTVFWPYPKFIAHRGAGRFAPENTLAAMRLGAQHGFSMMEYDVKLTRDGVAVLLHDDGVERTSNGTGNAGDQTYNELSAIDFGSWHSREYAGEPIPTLTSIAAYTQANHIFSNIEIKPHTGAEEQTGTQVAQLAAALWTDPATVPLLSSFSEIALAAALKAAPHLPRALLIAREIPADWADRLSRLKCIALNTNNKYTTKQLIDNAHAQGYKIGVWTVNDPVRARELLGWGCDAIFTDEIKTITPSF